LPPIGTFGAVIQEKSLPPSKNSLFDLGISGPIVGFVATAIVTLIGIQLSVLLPQVPPGGTEVPLPELFGVPLPFLFGIILTVFPPPGTGRVLWLHPVVQAGYIGMIVTMLNLMPIGQLDGGHVTHVLFGERAKLVLSILALVALVLAGYYFMAILAFLIARARHPDPLDGVSKLSTGRKLASVFVLAIIVLSFNTLTLVFF
jgi:membrane-associated protease RseP (regulator of RpoE activity)